MYRSTQKTLVDDFGVEGVVNPTIVEPVHLGPRLGSSEELVGEPAAEARLRWSSATSFDLIHDTHLEEFDIDPRYASCCIPKRFLDHDGDSTGPSQGFGTRSPFSVLNYRSITRYCAPYVIPK